MAYAQTDLDTLQAAIASGTKSVRYADGRMVEYQNVDAMLKAEAVIKSALATAAVAGSGVAADPRRRLSIWSRGFQ